MEWFNSFLNKRRLTRPNGDMLFSYRTTGEEYRALRELFANRLRLLKFAPWEFRSAAECACFVLYASEWWRREYNGGPWRWTHILQSLGEPFRLDVLERTAAVERGLWTWGHRVGGQGKKYLGAIVAQGGLPLKLISRGDGSITHLLIRAMRQAQLYGWDANRLESFFEAHQGDLVQHVRDQEIYRLFASVVVTVLGLRQEFRLAGASSPIEVLDRMQPNWRERFPIAVDDNSAEPLLVGLVREAAKEYAPVTTFPVIITRSLLLGEDGETYHLSFTAEMPASIAVSALASSVGLSPDALPQSFSLDLLGDERLTLGEGRQLLGATEPSVILGGRTRRLHGDAALAEHLLVLRTLGADLHAPAEIPDAFLMDGIQPWVFAVRETGMVLAGIGGCRIPENTCLVAVPDGFTAVAADSQSKVELKGMTEGLSQLRWIFEVQGSGTFVGCSANFVVRTAQTTELSTQIVWRGNRLPYRSGSVSVYMGVPSLYRVSAEGALQQVPTRAIEWTFPGNVQQRIESPRQHKGPIDAWLLEDGIRQRKFRLVLLPTDAKLRFHSGQTECGAAIEFNGWGVDSIDVSRDLNPIQSPTPCGMKLELLAVGRPPTHVTVSANWSNIAHAVRMDLPFPATGGRFTTAEGLNLPSTQAIPIRKVQSVRVQVFDRNPEAPKRYALLVDLAGRGENFKSPRAHVEHAIPIDSQGFGELRLLEVESSLFGLLCQSDQLDARLELRLSAGGKPIAKLEVTRYDAELEMQSHFQTVALLQSCMATLSAEDLSGVQLRARPLLLATAEEVALEQSASECTPTGRWSTAELMGDRGPWMVYPAATSTLQVRPCLHTGSFGSPALLPDKLCPLGEAMAIFEAEARAQAIADVITTMASDLDHVSWLLISRQYQVMSHLPLSTFDYWRVMARTPSACVAALLKLSHDIQALVGRMRDELGVVWELTPRSVLKEALVRLQLSWGRQLNIDASDSTVKMLSEQVFRGLGQANPILDDLVNVMLFQAGFERTERLNRLIGSFASGARPLVQTLWVGADSLLQRFLLRTHTEDRIWPHFDLTRTLISLLDEGAKDAVAKLIELCDKDMVWLPTAGQSGQYAKNIKEDVANAPLLASLASQLLPADLPWWSDAQLAQLRQIRTFDPAWFEQACRTGLLLSLIVEQHSAPPARAAVSATSTRTNQTAPGRALVSRPGLRRVPRTADNN